MSLNCDSAVCVSGEKTRWEDSLAISRDQVETQKPYIYIGIMENKNGNYDLGLRA